MWNVIYCAPPSGFPRKAIIEKPNNAVCSGVVPGSAQNPPLMSLSWGTYHSSAPGLEPLLRSAAVAVTPRRGVKNSP